MIDLDILIVEDENIRENIHEFFEIKGYQVKSTDKGAEAIKIIKENNPKIILLDIQLADDIGGIEILKFFKDKNSNIKFYIMSAYKDKYEEETKKLGAQGFFNKPVILKEIVDIVKNVI